MGKLTELYARDCAPIACNVHRRYPGIVAETLDVPLAWRGKYVLFTAILGDLTLLFGPSDMADVDASAYSELDSAALVANPECGDFIPAGSSARVYIPYAVTVLGTPSENWEIEKFSAVSSDESGGWAAFVLTEGAPEMSTSWTICPEIPE